MKRRVFIIHGWDSSPDDAWLPWLKKELEARGFDAIVPVMPNPFVPVIGEWIGHLRTVVGAVRASDIFVGHSVGCQTILRYLESQSDMPFAVPVLCVAGWFTLHGLESEEEKQIARPWLETPIDFDAVRNMCAPLDVILSDDDPYVDLTENKRIFENDLGGSVVVEHVMGHFSIEHGGVRELPLVLDIILQLNRSII
jgi:predicted alpha/beta hydrolase family esterase